MSAVSVTIGADTAQFDAAVNGLPTKVNKAGARMASSFNEAGVSMSRALAGIGAVGGLSLLVKRGLEFNKLMGDSEVGIASVLAQFQGLNDEAAKQEASKAMQQLIELEPRAAGTMSTLVEGFMATLAASQAAGLSVSQNIDLVGKFSNALAKIGLPAQQLAQEMRSIITGNVGADSSLAKSLNITNEMVKSATSAGTLYEALSEKIGKLGDAGDSAAVTFSTLSSAVDTAAGFFTKGLFDEAIGGAKELTSSVNENKEAWVSLGEGIGSAIKTASLFVKTVVNEIKAVTDLLAALNIKLETGLSFKESRDIVKRANEQASRPEPTLQKPSIPPAARLGIPVGEGNILSRTFDLFGSKFSQVAAPILNAVKQQITEQAGKLQSNAQSLQRAAFSPLAGDTDVSFGRAASVNPLTSGASAQIQQMMRQSALLKSQAEKIDLSNTLLGDIAETVKKQRFTLSYN